jgi:hypothetical protein
MSSHLPHTDIAKHATQSNIPATSARRPVRTTLQTNLALYKHTQIHAANFRGNPLAISDQNTQEPTSHEKWEDEEVVTIESSSDEDIPPVRRSKPVARARQRNNPRNNFTNALKSLGPRHSNTIGNEVDRPLGGPRPGRIPRPVPITPQERNSMSSSGLGLLTPVAGSQGLVDAPLAQGIAKQSEKGTGLRLKISLEDIKNPSETQGSYENNDLQSFANLSPLTPFYPHIDPISGAISFHRFQQKKRKVDENFLGRQSSGSPLNKKQRVPFSRNSRLKRAEFQEAQQLGRDLADIEVLEGAINLPKVEDDNIQIGQEALGDEDEPGNFQSDVNNVAVEGAEPQNYLTRRLRHEAPHYCPGFPYWGIRFLERAGPQTVKEMVRNATHSRRMWEERHHLPVTKLHHLPSAFDPNIMYVPPDEWIDQPGVVRGAFRAENSEGKVIMTWDELEKILIQVNQLLIPT